MSGVKVREMRGEEIVEVTVGEVKGSEGKGSRGSVDKFGMSK